MKEVVLTNEELDIIDRLQNSQFPSAGYDPYEVWCNLLWSGVSVFGFLIFKQFVRQERFSLFFVS